MARKKLEVKIRAYVQDVKQFRQMKRNGSTRITDLNRKYDSLVGRRDVVTDMVINKWLDDEITSKEFSSFVQHMKDKDYGEGCVDYVEDTLKDRGGEAWLLKNT